MPKSVHRLRQIRCTCSLVSVILYKLYPYTIGVLDKEVAIKGLAVWSISLPNKLLMCHNLRNDMLNVTLVYIIVTNIVIYLFELINTVC